MGAFFISSFFDKFVNFGGFSSMVRSLVCGTKDAGSNPVSHPNIMSNLYTPKTYSSLERQDACARAEYLGRWLCNDEIPRVTTPDEFLLMTLGTGYNDKMPEGKSLIVPTCMEGVLVLQNDPNDYFYVFSAVFNQAYDDCWRRIKKEERGYQPRQDVNDIAVQMLAEIAQKVYSGLKWDDLVGYTLALDGMYQVDEALLDGVIQEYLVGARRNSNSIFDLLLKTACIGVSFCMATHGYISETGNRQSLFNNENNEGDNQMKRILRNSQELRQKIIVPTSLIKTDKVNKARERAEAAMYAMKAKKISKLKGEREVIVRAWSEKEDEYVDLISTEQATQEAKRVFNTDSPTETQIRKIRFKLAGEIALGKLVEEELRQEISDIQGRVLLEIVQSLFESLKDRKEFEIRLPAVIRLRNQLLRVSPKLIGDRSISEKIMKIGINCDPELLENSLSVFDDLVDLFEQMFNGEQKDLPTDKELVEFILGIVLAKSIKLPNFKYPQNQKVDKVLLQLMSWWKADQFAIKVLERDLYEGGNSISPDQLNISMFTCLFCQIARLAEPDPEERAKYTTLNPLRSDFPTFLPYLIILQRVLEKSGVETNINLIIGNTDDQDTFSVSPRFRNEVFTRDMLKIARVRQLEVAKRMVDIGKMCGLDLGNQMYSDIRSNQDRTLGYPGEKGYSTSIDLVEERMEQAAGMIKTQVVANRRFASLIKGEDPKAFGYSFASMYVEQGVDLNRLRKKGYFLVDTMSPAEKSIIYCLDPEGLKSPPVNIFPQKRQIFDLLK